MARSSFTKYGDDEFVLRMDRENALKLMAIVARSACGSRLFDDEDENAGTRYNEIVEQLSLGLPREVIQAYRVVVGPGDEQIPVFRVIET